jgi:ERF superfamily
MSNEVAESVAVTPMRLLEIATQQGADIDKLSQLMALHERWEATQSKKAFDAALSAAKADIPVIQKNREVDFTSPKGRTNYHYEDMAEIARTIDPILGRHGLSYRFRTSSSPNEWITVTCIIAHKDGHVEENSISAPRDDTGNKNSIQAIGSTITFLQRYCLKAALGLAAAQDDDAQSAGKPVIVPDPEGKAKLEACGSIRSLNEAWKALTEGQRKTLSAVANECRERIKAADKEATQA